VDVVYGLIGANAMNYRDQTQIGGTTEAFLTTQWSLIENIRSTEDRDRALIGLLLEKYWKPVYCCLRRKGYDNEQAKDLTQGFFHEIVLNKNLVQRADQAKGKFRSFLLHALNQYVINEQEKQSAQKRIPRERLVPIDTIDPAAIPQRVSELDAEDSYNYAWLSALLDEVLAEVEAGCLRDGLETHWKVFQERVVEPILSNGQPPSLAELSERYGVEDEKKASNMAITVKRRFQAVLKEHVQRTVLAEDQISEELAELMKFFGDSAQHLE
jgi:RNA polymerase sigma-70 factor (ECF subfamily)